VLEEHNPLIAVGEEFHGPAAFVTHAFTASIAIYLAAAGALVAWFLYLKRPDLPAQMLQQFSGVHRVLINKYYFDWFNEQVLARSGRALAGFLWNVGDQQLIDGLAVNGSARAIGVLALVGRRLQSGYLYHYAFAMVIGLALLVGWLVFGAAA
jgi:NADH-quinone oxidoreductase subunit L